MKKNKIISIAIAVVALIILAVILKPKSEYVASSLSDAPTPKTELKNEPIQMPSITDRLKSALVKYSGKFDASNYRDDANSLKSELDEFAGALKLADLGARDSLTANKKLAASLKNKIIALQIQEFPKMRKHYADFAAKKLWSDDMEVNANGSGYTKLMLISAKFAANKNKESAQDAIRGVVSALRFKQVAYKWYSGESEYTYYPLDTPKDSAPVE